MLFASGVRLLVGMLFAMLFSAATVESATAQKVPEKVVGGCITAECHGDVKAGKLLHGPVNLNQCTPCHVQIGDQHKFQPIADSRALCLQCHDEEAKMAVVHPPFETDCAVCHNPHSSDTRYFVKGGLGAEGCASCHGDVREGMAHLHGPVAMGECLACHTAHQSPHAGLLIEPRRDLCLGCHIDVEESLKAAVSVHEPVGQDCAGCHDAHGGTTQFFLPQDGSAMCRECHADFLHNAENFKFPHEPMTDNKACRNCHAPHASNQQDLLSNKVVDLCMSCHSQEIVTERGVLANIAAQVENAEYLHGPLREGNCAACHEAHGSDHPDILEKAFPEKFYTPYEAGAYDLCFNCHDRTIVSKERGAETNFRNGDVNLHFVHVNKEKGRSCRACHHEHASNQPHHVRSEVPFGRWNMEIKFDKLETGGTCSTGCHLPYGYDRETPVDNKVAPK